MYSLKTSTQTGDSNTRQYMRERDDFDGGLIRRFVIEAPKNEVYEAFVEHIWYKNNPFGVKPDKLLETDLCKQCDIEYPQRSIACKTVLETIYNAETNQRIQYRVESCLLPTSQYHATVEFRDHYDSAQQIQCCLMIWSAQFNFRWRSCNYCCPFLAVLFRKIMEQFVNLMGNSLKSHVETKKQK